MMNKSRYKPELHPESEMRRRLKISQSLMGNHRGVSHLGPRSHRPGCPCGWHKGNPRSGPLSGTWKGGPVNLNGPGWNAARRAIWARDKVCRVCGGPPNPKRRLDVHHIVPRRDGGTNDESNLLGIHHGCHLRLELSKPPRP